MINPNSFQEWMAIGMKKLEEKIVREGVVLPGDVLKVGSFLNQRIDTAFTLEMADEIASVYKAEKITLVLTVEASGIALAFAVAARMGVPLLFAKKSLASNLGADLLTARFHSYTHQNDCTAAVDSNYLSPCDRVLIVDDFLARGETLCGMIELIKQAGATLCGCAIAIEKGFQGGGDALRAGGVRIESLAVIDSMSSDRGIVFRE